GIRDKLVTGVQTCALPIYNGLAGGTDLLFDKENGFLERLMSTPISRTSVVISRFLFVMTITSLQVLVILGVAYLFGVHPVTGFRSEERRVGKEWRSRVWAG